MVDSNRTFWQVTLVLLEGHGFQNYRSVLLGCSIKYWKKYWNRDKRRYRRKLLVLQCLFLCFEVAFRVSIIKTVLRTTGLTDKFKNRFGKAYAMPTLFFLLSIKHQSGSNKVFLIPWCFTPISMYTVISIVVVTSVNESAQSPNRRDWINFIYIPFGTRE